MNWKDILKNYKPFGHNVPNRLNPKAPTMAASRQPTYPMIDTAETNTDGSPKTLGQYLSDNPKVSIDKLIARQHPNTTISDYNKYLQTKDKSLLNQIDDFSLNLIGDNNMSWKKIIKEDEKHSTDMSDEIKRIKDNIKELSLITDKTIFKYNKSIEDDRETMAEIIEQLDDYISSVLVKVSKMK